MSEGREGRKDGGVTAKWRWDTNLGEMTGEERGGGSKVVMALVFPLAVTRWDEGRHHYSRTGQSSGTQGLRGLLNITWACPSMNTHTHAMWNDVYIHEEEEVGGWSQRGQWIKRDFNPQKQAEGSDSGRRESVCKCQVGSLPDQCGFLFADPAEYSFIIHAHVWPMKPTYRGSTRGM